MKKLLSAVAAIAASASLFAQSGNSGGAVTGDNMQADSSRSYAAKKGYIGISAGPSFPLGDFANASTGAKTGINVSLINIGYKFSKYFGFAANWTIGSVKDGTWTGEKKSWLYWGVSAGPMLSLPVAERLELDVKPMVGYSVVTLPDLGNGKESEVAFSYMGSVMGRYHLSSRVSVIANVDYYHTKATFDDYELSQGITALSVCAGIAYRFR